MKYSFLLLCLSALVLFSCKSEKKETGFTVTGTIVNNTGKMVYLEELPMSTMQAVIVDSAQISKNGTYTLRAGEKEATVFNLRLDKSSYPFAAIINDSKKMSVDVTFNKDNKEFPEKYDVKGSDASQQMKEFMFAFNNQLQQIFFTDKQFDSLRNSTTASDSMLTVLADKRNSLGEGAKKIAEDFIKRSSNPALTMFELGYYQTTANNQNYSLPPFDEDQVKEIVDALHNKYPSHTGISAIAKTLVGKVGMEAPEFSIPDASGSPVKLSSFRGKYVLVDFWASWCRPCRDENPNVVKAYNRFKDKNFAILGVSLDRPGEKDKWLKAVKDDQLTWNHVSDLMYWDSPVVAQYKIEGIPYNVLVDPSGKIIGEKLFGEKLESKLEEVLGK
jgi:peroxiredoxin